MVQLSHPYMATEKTIALTKQTFVRKVMSLLFNVLSSWVITFLPRSKHLLISWLQSPSAVIFSKVTQSCWLFATPWTVAYQDSPWDFPGKSTRVGCHFLLQGIFPTQGSNPGLLHCRQMLYCLSQPRQCVKKQRHYSANKSLYSQGYGLPSGHIRLWSISSISIELYEP